MGEFIDTLAPGPRLASSNRQNRKALERAAEAVYRRKTKARTFEPPPEVGCVHQEMNSDSKQLRRTHNYSYLQGHRISPMVMDIR